MCASWQVEFPNMRDVRVNRAKKNPTGLDSMAEVHHWLVIRPEQAVVFSTKCGEAQPAGVISNEGVSAQFPSWPLLTQLAISRSRRSAPIAWNTRAAEIGARLGSEYFTSCTWMYLRQPRSDNSYRIYGVCGRAGLAGDHSAPRCLPGRPDCRLGGFATCCR